MYFTLQKFTFSYCKTLEVETHKLHRPPSFSRSKLGNSPFLWWFSRPGTDPSSIFKDGREFLDGSVKEDRRTDPEWSAEDTYRSFSSINVFHNVFSYRSVCTRDRSMSGKHPQRSVGSVKRWTCLLISYRFDKFGGEDVSVGTY